MRGFALTFSFILVFAPLIRGAEQESVAELEQSISSSHESDSALAARLSTIQLTERLSGSELSALEKSLRGNKSREALTAIADMSSFLDPPSAAIGDESTPTQDEQRQIVARVVDYVVAMSHRLPNFFATRTTWQLEDRQKGMVAGDTVSARYIAPRLVGRSRDLITYRNGEEVLDRISSKNRGASAETGLHAWGLFGPVLNRVLVDAAHGTMKWSRWEVDQGNKIAVFRFAASMGKSSYAVQYCCVPKAAGLLAPIDRISAYHGEIAVDPDKGTVLRLTLQADLDKGELSTLLEEYSEGQPLTRADILVEYSPVVIGGKTYYCPTRSVAISRAHVLQGHLSGKQRTETLGPEKLFINDASFSDYHLFRSEARILTDSTP